MERNYRMLSRSILAMAVIAPAFIATKVAADNRGWNTNFSIQTIMAMVTIIGTAIMVIIHEPMVMAMDIQVGTIIMAIMTITTIIITGIITMVITI